MAKQPKILIYLFGSLGDTIVTIPALRAVQRHFRDAELVLLQNAQSDNLVKASEVVPKNLIDRYLSYSNELKGMRKVSGFYRLWKDLRRERFQSVVYLVMSERPERSVSRDKLFFQLCGIRDLIGFHAFTNEELYPVDETGHPAMTEHEAVRKLNRLRRDSIEILPDEDLRQPLLTFSDGDLESVASWLAGRRMKPDSRLIAIAPGCKTKVNDWPLENFIEIGRKLIEDENCEILIAGGKAEIELGENMVNAWQTGINAAGGFSVIETATLLLLCDFYIGLDTGTTHLAAAVGTPCFAIYGERNNPGQWFPLGDGHTVIFHPVECAGCLLFECPLPGHPCMNGISVDSVWKNLQTFMLKVSEREIVQSLAIPV